MPSPYRSATRAGELDFDHVTATKVTKVFGPTRALSDVSIELRAGTLSVLRGPNGSGKSTLLQILSTLMRPTAGGIRYGDATSQAGGSALRRRIGVLSHASHLYPDLTPLENLSLRARLYGLDAPARTASEAVARFEIAAFAERTCRTLSRGQLQRVALAGALLHSPRLVLLDEPTTGLDAQSVDRLCEALVAARAAGAILLLSTHDPALSERLADRQITLERGRLVSP